MVIPKAVLLAYSGVGFADSTSLTVFLVDFFDGLMGLLLGLVLSFEIKPNGRFSCLDCALFSLEQLTEFVFALFNVSCLAVYN